MKKFFLSLVVVAGSAAYALYQYVGGASAQAPAAQAGTTAALPSAPAAQQVTQASTAGAASAPQQQSSASAPAPASAPKGQYADGTYTGAPADAYYGTVEVQATISGGKIANVIFLQYPNDRSTSRYINSQAMPILTQEAIAAQSAQVSGVSGASDTSAAFIESLGSALAKAKNS